MLWSGRSDRVTSPAMTFFSQPRPSGTHSAEWSWLQWVFPSLVPPPRRPPPSRFVGSARPKLSRLPSPPPSDLLTRRARRDESDFFLDLQTEIHRQTCSFEPRPNLGPISTRSLIHKHNTPSNSERFKLLSVCHITTNQTADPAYRSLPRDELWARKPTEIQLEPEQNNKLLLSPSPVQIFLLRQPNSRYQSQELGIFAYLLNLPSSFDCACVPRIPFPTSTRKTNDKTKPPNNNTTLKYKHKHNE